MINNTPSLDLVEFIETQILPRYAAFDRAHNISTWSIPLPPITI